MTDLRAALVEALEPGPKGYLSITADEALDRILGVLADRADEWDQEKSERFMVVDAWRADTDGAATIHNLIAVLRGDTE